MGGKSIRSWLNDYKTDYAHGIPTIQFRDLVAQLMQGDWPRMIIEETDPGDRAWHHMPRWCNSIHDCLLEIFESDEDFLVVFHSGKCLVFFTSISEAVQARLLITANRGFEISYE
jgi:hypothetical protein